MQSDVGKNRSQMQQVWRRFKKNPLAMIGLCIIVLLIILALAAPLIAPTVERSPGSGVFDPGYDIQNLHNTFQMPSSEHIMGTDNLGRDIFSRVAHGARTTLMIGVLVVTVSMSIGITIGAISGYYGGVIDNVFMRIIDIMLATPTILLAIVIASTMDPGLTSVLIAVAIGGIPGYARIVRGSVLSVRGQEYIEAARAIGANDFRIITKHVIPNCIAPIIVESTMGMAGAIGSAAALSFLGLGPQAPSPEWGAMLSEGRRFMIMGHWPMVVFPGLAIALIIFALNMMGDGLRDAFDPRLKR